MQALNKVNEKYQLFKFIEQETGISFIQSSMQKMNDGRILYTRDERCFSHKSNCTLKTLLFSFEAF